MKDYMPTMADVRCPNCTFCGKGTILSLPEYAVKEWQAGMLVQRAFPEMLPAQRELLISGTHPDCWGKFMVDDEDDE
jgi:hypothetical protein